MYKYSFEKLNVWERSIDLIKTVYTISKSFPDEEKFGITSQLRRAALSVSNNLAEGNSRLSQKDQAHFIQISFSSLMEVLNILIASKELGFLNNEAYLQLRELIDEIANKLTALHKRKIK